MAQGKFVAYYRVSTQRQGRSGLGLEAQKQAVRDYLNGGSWELLAEFTEVESGKSSDRTQLQAALAACRAHRATLVIAKLDRLARNVAFVATLMEAGVEFVAVDFPQANRLMLHILVAVAQNEAEAISTRTKAALQAAKSRGVKLGGFRGRAGTAEDTAKARAVQSARAIGRAVDLAPTIARVDPTGSMSLRALAQALNAEGIPTPTGKGEWTAIGVSRLRARLAGAA